MTKKKFNMIYCISLAIPLLLLVFPLFSMGNRSTPLVFGLPFSFFWVLFWIVMTFVIVLILYRLDPDKDEEEVS
ncbi:DUF3311 domain-containing protein [Alkalihalobacillus sp. R86527]|uniref:DUF3311 domain-containing protein n=1 Tax=Alkalihalobacillus sp. R86527 TaxID=3093863 RepID=UPI0036719245